MDIPSTLNLTRDDTNIVKEKKHSEQAKEFFDMVVNMPSLFPLQRRHDIPYRVAYQHDANEVCRGFSMVIVED